MSRLGVQVPSPAPQVAPVLRRSGADASRAVLAVRLLGLVRLLGKRTLTCWVSGQVPKWPTGLDCKSSGLRLRRFESSPVHDAAPRGAASGGSSSVGRASAFQAEGRGFESRLPLGVLPRLFLRKTSRVPGLGFSHDFSFGKHRGSLGWVSPTIFPLGNIVGPWVGIRFFREPAVGTRVHLCLPVDPPATYCLLSSAVEHFHGKEGVPGSSPGGGSS